MKLVQATKAQDYTRSKLVQREIDTSWKELSEEKERTKWQTDTVSSQTLNQRRKRVLAARCCQHSCWTPSNTEEGLLCWRTTVPKKLLYTHDNVLLVWLLITVNRRRRERTTETNMYKFGNIKLKLQKLHF